MKTLGILVVLYLFTINGLSSGSLERQRIVTNEKNALCCDRNPAVYYLEEGDSDDWVIFFEGGGGCSTAQECNERYLNDSTRILMSAKKLTQSIEGKDLLSNNMEDNPLFHGFTHVLVPYCSQDAFLANSSLPVVDLGDSKIISYVFRGRVILQSIIQDLLPLGLNSSKRVVLAGSSAGGVGILNNLEWIKDQLSPSVELSLIIDSSWFIPYSGYHAIDFSLEDANFYNLDQPACFDHSLGFPCCTSLACLLTDDSIQRSLPPTFFVTSLFDIFTLEESLKDIIEMLDFSASAEISDQDFLRMFNTYGALMNSTLLDTFAHRNNPNVSVFAPSCTQHVFLATSSLWDENGLLNATVDGSFTEDVFRLTNPVKSGQWNSVKINMTINETRHISLHEALQNWYNDSKSQVFYADVCRGPACGECPSTIRLEFTYDLWANEAIIAVLVVSSVMAALPLFIKLFLYMYMKCMLYRQKLYIYNITRTQKNKPKFPKAVHAVSVSCTNLYYLLDTTENTNKPELEQNEVAHIHDSHYRLSAFANTVVPCCKPLCYRYNAPVGDSECGKAGSPTQPNPTCFNGLKSDSGISSSNVSQSINKSYSDATSMDLIIESRPSPVHKPPKSSSSSSSSRKKKVILRQVNMYVNPGELLAIMGPSGSGKTTLLDVILGRRRTGHVQGDIYVNGSPLTKMRDWFIMNTGYVRQLATSFYNELTIRENLLFSMNMQAPAGMTLTQKLERVEQVIRETGLQEQADFVVGSGIGLGLSGGQRKRLTIAVQLLSMPNIIFLDEPTSGLDSASSLDILKSLQVMAGTGRAIVVTIHQPRSEIFHAFDKILLLCKGQVAFFGSPVKVWDFFQRAIINEELEKHEGQVQDQILDHLKEKKSQDQVLNAYNKSLEPKKVKSAVLEGREHTDSAPSPIYKRDPGLWQRLVSLEARASLRQTFFSIIYLPVVYTVFGALLGTTYLRTQNPLQVMSVTCLLSCSSSLFMSSIVMSLLIEPLKLFQLEQSDGVSRSYELILQVFFRMSFVGTIPLSVCATLVFALVYLQEDFQVYVIVLLSFLLVNQVWISIFILLTVLAPSQAHRLCPVFAAVGGFWCGFIIPKPLMPDYYEWIFYINPSYYAYSATSVTVLNGLDLQCSRASELECFRTSGYAVLSQFGISDVNPFFHMVILMIMTFIILLLAVSVLQLRVSLSLIIERLKNWLYSCKKRNNTETKICSSTDNLNEVDTPLALKSFRRNRLPGETKESIQQARTNALSATLSAAFIESNTHQIYHNFPWERNVLEEADGLDGGEPNLFSPISSGSRRSRLGSDGSENVFEPPELISMSVTDEEHDEDIRRKQAEQKWEARRLKIETEIRRLRVANIHRKAALRHSIASFGDDLEDQIFDRRESSMPRKRYLSTANQISENGTKGLEIEKPPVRKEKPPFMRAISLPTTGALFSKMAGVPTLDTYEEEDDEMMDLPPKDIPHLRESMEHMEKIDYEDIPPQQLSAVPSSQESNGSRWSEHEI